MPSAEVSKRSCIFLLDHEPSSIYFVIPSVMAAANTGKQPRKLNGVTVTALAEKVAKPKPCGDPIMDEQKNRARDKWMELLSLLEPNEQHHDQVLTHLRSLLNVGAEKTAGKLLAEFRAAYPSIGRLDKEYIARILVVAAK